MTRHQRAQFITDLMDSMKSSLLNKAERMPDDWDGYELRQFLKDFVAENAIFRPMDRRRARAYRNECLVRNL